MTDTLEDANAALRSAVRERLDATPADDPKMVGYHKDAEELEDPTEIDDPGEAGVPNDFILQAARQLERERLRGDGILKAGGEDYAEWVAPSSNGHLRPGSREFVAVLDELKSLHMAKTLDYGVDEDALSNIRQSADVLNISAWAGCILRISDKMHRLKAFFRRGKCEFDGIEDTLKDIACYAAIALVLHREEASRSEP